VNVTEAKQVLLGCRPDGSDLRSPEAAAALDLARRDADLGRWWEQQQAFHRRVRQALLEVPAPASLRDRIIARAKVVELPWWRRPAVWSAAAAVAILVAVVAVWHRPAPEDSFTTFRARMAGAVLRQYRMDVETNDMAAIRGYLATRQAPADYTLPPTLDRLPAMGGGVLSWRDRKVSMVCLDSGAQGTLFLFIVDRASLKDPPASRAFAAVKDLNTVSWTEGGKTYVLAADAQKAGKEWFERLL